MSTDRHMTLNAGKPVHGPWIYSRQWAGATAIAAGTAEDE